MDELLSDGKQQEKMPGRWQEDGAPFCPVEQ